jgi:hypothetical protein
VQTDPLANSVAPEEKDEVTHDFYLTICQTDWHKATSLAQATQYAIRAKLEIDDTNLKEQEKRSCGGEIAPGGDFQIN